ncbi:MAG: bifunctional demethylmenaquinone methyltransferase/2-methoxy-6-polyprenyl-1,4-benzoquinol methylase UbiE [Dysgonamonadaceae bacterium]|nr:bifunctional demethylmenaquinone methyltransferase/2-methoxy-6-polyprenyl-1,4-benzoquinol methylase UbiE [Dysgonamonadaceae bacterium]
MSYKSEETVPYKTEESKSVQVEHMFDGIASRYDAMNSCLSLGLDMSWLNKALRKLQGLNTTNLLDLATGMGDFAILANDILKPEKITGIDISDGMMDVGRVKVKKAKLDNVISFEHQDCASMSFNDESFDAAIASFGVRNFEDIDKCFREIVRVLNPGGVFMFLELTTPTYQPFKFFYNIYSHSFIPFITRLLSKDKRAYDYLPASIKAFPQGKEMVSILKKCGFETVESWTLTLGVCTIYLAKKPTV